MHDPIIVVIRFERAARHYCVVSLLLEYLIVFILFFGRLNIKSIDYGYQTDLVAGARWIKRTRCPQRRNILMRRNQGIKFK